MRSEFLKSQNRMIVQELFDSCRIVKFRMARSEEGAEEAYAPLPQGISREDKYALGVYRKGELTGVIGETHQQKHPGILWDMSEPGKQPDARGQNAQRLRCDHSCATEKVPLKL